MLRKRRKRIIVRVENSTEQKYKVVILIRIFFGQHVIKLPKSIPDRTEPPMVLRTTGSMLGVQISPTTRDYDPIKVA